MILTKETFRNGTEVDLTNRFHETPSLTLFFTKRNDIEFFTIKNYMTNEVWHNFGTLHKLKKNRGAEAPLY